MQAVGQQQGWAAGLNPGPASAHAPSLAQLLARWGVAGAPPLPLAERVGASLDWTDAVLLSQALAVPAAAAATPPSLQSPQAAADWAQAALERLQAELRAGFADPVLVRESAEPLAAAIALPDALAPYRLHHGQQQRTMAVRVAGLRERLRGALSACGFAPLVRLAQLDAVFDRALAVRERQSLAGLANLLFGQRAAAHQGQQALRWRSAFWVDLQLALQAELDFRLQAVFGLIEALQAEAARQAAA